MAKTINKGTRDQRIARATELIKTHPGWGKDHVNKALQQEYGVGLQRIFVAHLKTETLKPTLTVEQKREQKLIDKGFLPSEAKPLSKYQITSPVMVNFIRERQQLIRQAKKDDVPRSKVTQQIKLDYRISGYTKKGKTDVDKALADWANRFIEREKLKKEVAYSAPPKVTYTEEQHRIFRDLRAHGFTKYEAQILAKGDTTVQAFGTQTWRDAMEATLKYYNDLRARGWSDQQITRERNGYYKKGIKRSPFDHIRKYDSYKAPKPKADEDELGRALKRQKQTSGQRKATRRVKSYFQGALGMGL
jgi:hypothetical protein